MTDKSKQKSNLEIGHPDQGEVFVRLLIEHEPKVRSFLRGLLPTWTDVDEVIQEASLIAWRKFADFEEGTAFGGWFLTIARFEALKHRRQLARTPLKFADELWNKMADEAESDNVEIKRQHLETCLQKLPVEKKEMLLKVYVPGAVMREIALQSGKSEQAFYKIIQRLRVTLSNCISRLSAMESA